MSWLVLISVGPSRCYLICLSKPRYPTRLHANTHTLVNRTTPYVYSPLHQPKSTHCIKLRSGLNLDYSSLLEQWLAEQKQEGYVRRCSTTVQSPLTLAVKCWHFMWLEEEYTHSLLALLPPFATRVMVCDQWMITSLLNWLSWQILTW